jgi:hypothetical protein
MRAMALISLLSNLILSSHLRLGLPFTFCN